MIDDPFRDPFRAWWITNDLAKPTYRDAWLAAIKCAIKETCEYCDDGWTQLGGMHSRPRGLAVEKMQCKAERLQILLERSKGD